MRQTNCLRLLIQHFGKSLPGGASTIVADTVGFVQNLPHALVDAFRATLEEAAEADALMFVQDGAHGSVDARTSRS